eukprot:6475695-Amphidinium_carterae.1
MGGAKRGRHDQWAPCYDPPHEYSNSMQPHCLFACSLHMAQIPVTMQHIRELRESVHAVLSTAHNEHVLICGQLVEAWIKDLDYTVEEFLATTNSRFSRPGTTLDLIVITSILATPLWLVDSRGHLITKSTHAPPTHVIRHHDSHFTVIDNHLAINDDHLNHNIQQFDIQDVLSPASNPLMNMITRSQRIREGYTHPTSMQLYSEIKDAFLQIQLVIPAFIYATVQRQPRGSAMLKINGNPCTMGLPQWTSFCYVAAQIRTPKEVTEDIHTDLCSWAHYHIMHQITDLAKTATSNASATDTPLVTEGVNQLLQRFACLDLAHARTLVSRTKYQCSYSATVQSIDEFLQHIALTAYPFQVCYVTDAGFFKYHDHKQCPPTIIFEHVSANQLAVIEELYSIKCVALCDCASHDLLGEDKGAHISLSQTIAFHSSSTSTTSRPPSAESQQQQPLSTSTLHPPPPEMPDLPILITGGAQGDQGDDDNDTQDTFQTSGSPGLEGFITLTQPGLNVQEEDFVELHVLRRPTGPALRRMPPSNYNGFLVRIRPHSQIKEVMKIMSTALRSHYSTFYLRTNQSPIDMFATVNHTTPQLFYNFHRRTRTNNSGSRTSRPSTSTRPINTFTRHMEWSRRGSTGARRVMRRPASSRQSRPSRATRRPRMRPLIQPPQPDHEQHDHEDDEQRETREAAAHEDEGHTTGTELTHNIEVHIWESLYVEKPYATVQIAHSTTTTLAEIQRTASNHFNAQLAHTSSCIVWANGEALRLNLQLKALNFRSVGVQI